MLDLNSELRWHLSPLLIHPWQLKPILLGVEGGGRVCLSLSYIWNGLMVYKLFPFKIHLSFKKLVARQYTWYDSIWGKMLFAYKKKKNLEKLPQLLMIISGREIGNILGYVISESFTTSRKKWWRWIWTGEKCWNGSFSYVFGITYRDTDITNASLWPVKEAGVGG